MSGGEWGNSPQKGECGALMKEGRKNGRRKIEGRASQKKARRFDLANTRTRGQRRGARKTWESQVYLFMSMLKRGDKGGRKGSKRESQNLQEESGTHRANSCSRKSPSGYLSRRTPATGVRGAQAGVHEEGVLTELKSGKKTVYLVTAKKSFPQGKERGTSKTKGGK